MKNKEQIIKDAVDKEEKRLFHFIRSLVPDRQDAEDILQDVFYQLIVGIGEINQLERLNSWMFGVARNKVKDWYKKSKPINFGTISNGGESLVLEEFFSERGANQEEELWKEAVWEVVDSVLDSLPQHQSDVFIWHEIEGHSFSKISQTTGISINTLLSRKRKVVLVLRESLDELYNEMYDK